MKSFYKVILFCLGAILINSKVIAQTTDTSKAAGAFFKPFSKDDLFRTWSVGINAGTMTFSNILNRNNSLDFTSPNTKIGYSFYVKKQLFPSLGIQGQVLAGSLSADNSQQTTNGDPNYLHVNSSLNYAASLNLIFSFTNFNWHYNSAGVQPFLGVGFGMMKYHPKLTTVDETGTIFTTTNAGSATGSFVPLQVGLKFNVSSNINVDIAYQLNLAMTDNIDGNVYGSSNDKFSYFNVGLEFALGNRSKPQMATYSTTPSRNVRVVIKKEKIKPAVTKVDTVKVQAPAVQPDNNLLKDKMKALSMDSDSDGVADYFDKCANTPHGTVVDNDGCPILDASGKGKAELTPKEKQVIVDAARSLEFSNGKSSYTKSSPQPFDEFLRLLIQKRMDTNFPSKVLIISGRANESSSDLDNLALSRERAETVKRYLISKGIKASNIITVGYGNEKPATSDDNAGKNTKRGVEFNLY